MKIVETKVTECVQPVGDVTWAFAKGKVPEMRGWIVHLTDEAGNVGYGFAHSLAQTTSTSGSVRSALDFLLPMVIGRDDEDRPKIVDDLDTALLTAGTAKGGIEMALFDLMGRRARVSTGALLGGRFRSKLELSRVIPLKQPEDMANVGRKLVSEGYSTLKLKLSGQPELDTNRVKAVREAVGPKVVFTLDPNQAYTMKGFVSLFKKIEQYDIAVVEQPVHFSDIEGLAILTRTLPTIVEADESARSVADVAYLARTRAVDAVNIKVTKFGSVRDAQLAMAMCEANGIEIRFGTAFGPSLLQAFHAHLAASVKKLAHACELAEHVHLGNDPFSDIKIENGVMYVPTGPGTGVDPK